MESMGPRVVLKLVFAHGPLTRWTLTGQGIVKDKNSHLIRQMDPISLAIHHPKNTASNFAHEVKLVFTMLIESSIYKFQLSSPFSTRKGREENGVETRQAPEVKIKKKKEKQTTAPVGSKQIRQLSNS